MLQTAGHNRAAPRRPRRIGRVFLAGLLLGADSLLLVIWAIWFARFLGGSDSLMTVNDVQAPIAFALLLGPLALASVGAIVLISMLRAYLVVLGIAVVWLVYALVGFVSGGFAVGMLVATRVAILVLLVSGRPAFRDE